MLCRLNIGIYQHANPALSTPKQMRCASTSNRTILIAISEQRRTKPRKRVDLEYSISPELNHGILIATAKNEPSYYLTHEHNTCQPILQSQSNMILIHCTLTCISYFDISLSLFLHDKHQSHKPDTIKFRTYLTGLTSHQASPLLILDALGFP